MTQTARAFTGHEQIGEISGLIHMNARVYDSDIGRFLSADTVIQDPHDSQAYNRYSYVRNNPLVFTDPSGHSWFSKLWKKIKSVVIAVVVAVIAVYTAGMVLGALGVEGATYSAMLANASFGQLVISGAASGFASGASMGLLSGASLGQSLAMGVKGAVFGAIGAGVANVIGSAWGGATSMAHKAGRAILHGLSRAAISRVQGGKWSAGFWSGFAGSALGGLSNYAKSFGGKMAISAIVGGTASRLGGGKFANGAVSAAFVHMYNAMSHPTYLSKDEMYRVSYSEWKGGDKGIYRTLMVNGTDRGIISDFNAYGSSGADKFFYGLGNGAVNGVNFLRSNPDGAGLALSLGAAVTTGGISYLLGGTAILIDVAQGDPWGVAVGGAAMIPQTGKAGAVADIGYGIGQLF